MANNFFFRLQNFLRLTICLPNRTYLLSIGPFGPTTRRISLCATSDTSYSSQSTAPILTDSPGPRKEGCATHGLHVWFWKVSRDGCVISIYAMKSTHR